MGTFSVAAMKKVLMPLFTCQKLNTPELEPFEVDFKALPAPVKKCCSRVAAAAKASDGDTAKSSFYTVTVDHKPLYLHAYRYEEDGALTRGVDVYTDSGESVGAGVIDGEKSLVQWELYVG